MDFPKPQRLTVRGLGKAPLVLAVDDDEDSLVLLTYILELLGCSAITAESSQQALELVKINQFDLILLDIVLPDINGMELLRLLRQDREMQKIAAIAVTGLAFLQEREQIKQAGFNGYICKPYLVKDLESLIGRFFEDLIQPFNPFKVTI